MTPACQHRVHIQGSQPQLGWGSHLMLLRCSCRSLLSLSCSDCRSPPFWGQALNIPSQLRFLWHPAICCFHLLLTLCHSERLQLCQQGTDLQPYCPGSVLSSMPQVPFPFMLAQNWPVVSWFIGLKAGWWCRNDDSQPGLHGHKETKSSVKCRSYHILCVFKCKCV